MTIEYKHLQAIKSITFSMVLLIIQLYIMNNLDYFRAGEIFHKPNEIVLLLLITLFSLSGMYFAILKLIKVKRSDMVMPINKKNRVWIFDVLAILLLIVLVILFIQMNTLLFRVFIINFLVIGMTYVILSVSDGVYQEFLYYKGIIYPYETLTIIESRNKDVYLEFVKKEGFLKVKHKIELSSDSDEHVEFVRAIKNLKPSESI